MNCPHLSASRADLYRNCPYAYGLRYSYEGAPFPQPLEIPLENGSAIHKAIDETFMQYRSTGIWESNFLIKTYIKSALNLPKETIKETSKELKNWVKSYTPPTNIIGTEQRHEITIDDVPIVAIMDLVYVDDEGSLVIVDWKSHKYMPTSDTLSENLQAPLYLYIAKRVYPGYPKYKFFFHFIRCESVVEWEYTDSELEFTWAYLKIMYDKILNDKVPRAIPSINCQSCPGIRHSICPLTKSLLEHGVEGTTDTVMNNLKILQEFKDDDEISKYILEKKTITGLESVISNMKKTINKKLLNVLVSRDISADIVNGYKLIVVHRQDVMYDTSTIMKVFQHDPRKLQRVLDIRKTVVNEYIKDGYLDDQAVDEIKKTSWIKSRYPYVVIRKVNPNKVSAKKTDDDDITEETEVDTDGW